MKISRIGLAIVCLSVYVSPVGAQTPAEAAKLALQVERQAANQLLKGPSLMRAPFAFTPPSVADLRKSLRLNQPPVLPLQGIPVTSVALPDAPSSIPSRAEVHMPSTPPQSPVQSMQSLSATLDLPEALPPHSSRPVTRRTSSGTANRRKHPFSKEDLDKPAPEPVAQSHEPERYVSPFADFLKEEWEMPELPNRSTQCGFSSCWVDPEASFGTGIDPLRAAAIEFGMPTQISRETLQMQARGLGIPAQNIEYASSPELWLLINLYEAMAKSGEIISRYDEFVQSAAETTKNISLEQWARQQPDFVQENYVYKEYYEPFNQAVTQLRILIINDTKKYFNLLLEIAEQDSRITVDHVDSVVAAFPALKTSRPKYDIVLTDYYTHAGNALELSMWAHKNGVKVPIVFFSNADGTASYLYSYNLAGRIGINQPIRSVVNYLSNLVATGKAYPGIGE